MLRNWLFILALFVLMLRFSLVAALSSNVPLTALSTIMGDVFVGYVIVFLLGIVTGAIGRGENNDLTEEDQHV